MSESIFSLDHILVNYYTFGSLLVTVIIGILAIFFLSLHDKTKSTYHLGLACAYLALFQFGYFLAALYYHPIAAFHRWFTVGFILFGILHFGQFFYRFPGNENGKVAGVIARIMYPAAVIAVIWFFFQTYNSPKKYHFTAHHWDFNAEGPSKVLGIMIVIYSLICFIVLPGIKIYTMAKGKRRAITGMAVAGLIAAVVPNVTNVMSRDGAMERSTFLTSLVLLFTLSFFMITIIFINTSSERTTFMVKIVGISAVTMLLIMQAFSYMVDQEKETAFDNFSIQMGSRALEGGEVSKSIVYIIDFDPLTNEFKSENMLDSVHLDIPLVQADMYNTYLHDIIEQFPEDNFRSQLKAALADTPYFFQGYKDSILDFIEKSDSRTDAELRKQTFAYFEKLNKLTFVNSNKLSDIPAERFCLEGKDYIKKTKNIEFFKQAILGKIKDTDCSWDGKSISEAEYRREFLKYFRNFKAELTRHYRKDLNDLTHYVTYMKHNPNKKIMQEVGYFYKDYRNYMHKSAKLEILILGVVLLVLLIVFPLFFKATLVDPLYSLLSGVEKVNAGNLDIEVPIQVNDEIGYLSESFNGMVSSIKDARRELQDYAENLEEKVKDRTKALQEKMDEVNRLKVQQDGDYFLTSLLAKPLFFNANKSKTVNTDFFVHQKKKFEFRNKVGDLGGDICVTGNLKLGKPDNFRRYTMVMNGDAMGKSMQGAGGSLVMGVAINAIMARSASNKRILNRTPEEWLTDVYEEINSVFKSFNGTMVISATIMLIDDETGEVFFFNAEHPFTVLYRDGKASFIEEELKLRKLGLDSEYAFEVQKFQLLPGDQIILASDGRDDIDLTPDEDVRTINEDETLILKYVEQADGDIYQTEKYLKELGELTDDMSMMSIFYRKQGVQIEEEPKPAAVPTSMVVEETIEPEEDAPVETIFEPKTDDWDKVLTADGAFEEGKEYYQNGDLERAIQVLAKAFKTDNSNHKLNKFLGLISYKGKDYQVASEVLSTFLKDNEGTSEYWYYLSMSEKKLGNYEAALKAAQEALKLDPNNFQNLVNLADVSRLLGNTDRAYTYVTRAQGIDPENKNVKKLTRMLEKATSLN